MKKEYKLFINGQDVPSSSNTIVDDISPSTGKAFAKVHMASKEDIESAIDAAHKASKSWANTTPREREAILLKAADIFESRTEEIREILITETGSAFGKSMFEIGLVADIFRVAAGECRRVAGYTHATNETGMLSYSIRRPLGVIAGIAPFNAPMILSSKKFAFAIAAGNTFVLKPSSNTAITGLVFGEIFKEAGLPDGVFNVIPCSSSVLGETFQTDKRVKMITFTGSTSTGKLIASSAAANLTKFTVELGGKSPMIILNDADVDYAVDTAAFSIFMHQGQICMAGSKIIVQEEIFDKFAEKFAAKISGIKASDPSLPTTVVGPLIEEAQCSFIDGLVNDAVSKGAKVLCGNSHSGCFYEPTVISYVTEEMKVYHDEAFGPVAALIKVKTVEEAVEVANMTNYGLSSAVITNDIGNALKLSEEIEAGMVHINGPTIMDEAHIPFGGIKDSGMGREGGHFSIEEMTELKWVTVEALGNHHYPF